MWVEHTVLLFLTMGTNIPVSRSTGTAQISTSHCRGLATKTNLQHACTPGPSGGVGSLVPLDPRLRRSSFLLFSRTVISLAAHPVPRPHLVTWFSYSQSQTLLNVSCFPSPPGVHQLQPLPPSQVPTTFQLRASTMQVYNIVRSDPMCQSSPGGRN